MATTSNSTIFPPLMKDSMPAFLFNEPCRIYFSLSEFNDPERVKYCPLISIRDQRTNTSILDHIKFPTGYMLKSHILEDKTI